MIIDIDNIDDKVNIIAKHNLWLSCAKCLQTWLWRHTFIFILPSKTMLNKNMEPPLTETSVCVCLHFKENTSLAAQGALAHRLQRRTACNVAPPATPLRPTYTPQIKKRRSLLYSNLGAPINFRKTSFLIRATFRLPSPYGGRQTSLGPPKSKNGDHFSIVIWALRTTFAK